jgi:hypothetical protein
MASKALKCPRKAERSNRSVGWLFVDTVLITNTVLITKHSARSTWTGFYNSGVEPALRLARQFTLPAM